MHRLPNPSEYDAALQELEGLIAQLYSAREDGATAGTSTTTTITSRTTNIKVSTYNPSPIQILFYLISIHIVFKLK